MFTLLTNLKHRNFQRLWMAQLVSQFGDRIHQLALVGLLAERSPGSAMELAKLIAFTIFPVFIIQPIAGVIVDRLNYRTTLFVCDVVRGFLVLLIPFVFFYQDSMVPIYIIVFLVFCFSRFHVPAKMAIIPDLVEDDNLLKANSLFTTTGMIATALGAALGGFLVEAYGARNGFIIDGATYFVSAVFLFSMSGGLKLKQNKQVFASEGKQALEQARKTFKEDFKEGLKYLVEHKEIRFILNIVFLLFASVGAIYVVIIVFVQEAFGSATKHLGILAVCLALGLLAGAILYGQLGKKVSWYKTIFGCLLLSGLICMGFAQIINVYPNIWVALGLAFFWGMIIGPIIIAGNTIIHLVSDESMRGKVFSALEIIIHLAFLVAMFLTSWLSEFIARVWILTGVGVVVSFISLLGFLKPLPTGVLAQNEKE